MTCDLVNMVRQAILCIRSRDDHGAYRYALAQLVEHLREVKREHLAGNAAILDEFFALYLIDEKAEGKPLVEEVNRGR